MTLFSVPIRLMEGATLPTHGSNDAAGYDLYCRADDTITIMPGEMKKISTGVIMSIPKGYGGFVFARSGLATKKGLRPANAVGVIDADFRAEIIVPLYNDSCELAHINPGDRIAQIAFLPIQDNVTFLLVDDLDTTKRGTGGFGSTGV